MAFPTLKVYVYFDDGPLTTAGGATDISSYVRLNAGVHITRGGTGDPDRPDQTGILNLTLDNRTRIFDPLYSSGTYYGKLTPKKQIVVKALWSGTEYPMFWGWVTGWPNTRTNMGKDNVVELEAYDALGYAAGVRCVTDLLAAYMDSISTGPSVHCRGVETGRWVDRIGGLPAPAVGTISPTSIVSRLLPGLRSAAWQADGTGCYDPYSNIPNAGADAHTRGFWIQSTVDGSEYADGKAPIFGYGIYSGVGIATGGDLVSATGGGTDTFDIKLNDGLPHFVCFTYNPSGPGTLTLYVDGVVIDTRSPASTQTGYYIGGKSTAANPTTPSIFLKSSTIQDVFTYEGYALTAAEVAMINDLARGVVVESTAARVGRVLDDAGIPAGLRDVSTSTVGECGPLSFDGQSALPALQQIERTEQGRLYASKDGKITFRQRYYAYEDTRSKTVQATFSDDGADETYRSFGHKLAYEDICNDATVTNGVTEARATDTASSDAYGTNAATFDTLLPTQQQALDMARGVVFLRKDPALRVDPIAISITPTSWPTILGLELADRVQVESTPMAVGSQIVADVLLDQIHWDIDEAWRMKIAGSPVPPDPVSAGFWVLGTSELDTGTVLAF